MEKIKLNDKGQKLFGNEYSIGILPKLLASIAYQKYNNPSRVIGILYGKKYILMTIPIKVIINPTIR